MSQEITVYDIYGHGHYVLHSDHIASLKVARAEDMVEIDKLRSQLNAIIEERKDMILAIEYSDKHSGFSGSVMVDKIVFLSKTVDGITTLIHLTTGEILESDDSVKTLHARINATRENEK